MVSARIAILAAALAVLGLASQASAAAYIASVVYAKNPLPAGVNLTPELDRTAFITIAELNQNVTTEYTLFNWELTYEPVPGGAVPVKVEIVKFTPGATPSNGQVIYTLVNAPAGILPGTPESSGMFDLAQFNAGRLAAGMSPVTVCDPNNACENPGPSTMIHFGADQLYVITFNNGKVITGFAAENPDIPYPEPSEDNFYVGVFNGSYGIGLPALTGDNDVTFAVYNNFDEAQTWSMDVLTTFSNTTTNAKVTAIKLVSLVNGAPVTILDLSKKVDLNDPATNDFGVHTDNAFTYPELTKAMRDAGILVPSKIMGAVTTTTDGTNVFQNYMNFIPEWIQDPKDTTRYAPPPPPPERIPTPPKVCVYSGNYKIVPVAAACKGKSLRYSKDCKTTSVFLSSPASLWTLKASSSGKVAKPTAVSAIKTTCAAKNLAVSKGKTAKLGGSAWKWGIVPAGDGTRCEIVNLRSADGFVGVSSACDKVTLFKKAQSFKLIKV